MERERERDKSLSDFRIVSFSKERKRKKGGIEGGGGKGEKVREEVYIFHFNGLQLRGMIIVMDASRFRVAHLRHRLSLPSPLLSVRTRELLSTELVRIDLSAEC